MEPNALEALVIAGAGFAMMAVDLAQLRVVKKTFSGWIPWPRHEARPGTVSEEYYRILDRAWQFMPNGDTVQL